MTCKPYMLLLLVSFLNWKCSVWHYYQKHLSQYLGNYLMAYLLVWHLLVSNNLALFRLWKFMDELYYTQNNDCCHLFQLCSFLIWSRITCKPYYFSLSKWYRHIIRSAMSMHSCVSNIYFSIRSIAIYFHHNWLQSLYHNNYVSSWYRHNGDR